MNGKPGLHVPVVGSIIENPVRFRVEGLTGRDHIHEFRKRPLCGFQQVRVERQLENCCCFGFTGELAIVGLIGPVAEPACALYLAQHVSSPEPVAVSERGLDDDVHTGLHGQECFSDGLLITTKIPETDDGKAARPQMLDIAIFVSNTPLPHNLRIRGVPSRCKASPGRHI